MKHTTDLVIITSEPFPIGMAATNRIISYAKTIANHKHVKILIPTPTENKENINNNIAKGKIENLDFEYTNKTTIWPYKSNKITKTLTILIGLFNLIRKIFTIKPRTVIIYSSRSYLRITVLILKSFLKFNLVAEENEYPKILKKTKNRHYLSIHLGFYKKCDGMVVITKELETYYKSIDVKNIFHLPMTVDISRFESEHDFQCDIDYEYFIYVGGNGGFERDGVVNIIESFGIFNQNYPDVKLIIIGNIDANSSITEKINSVIDSENLKQNIVLLGNKPSYQIPCFLKKSLGIVMAPQKNYLSGGFPTKLGEFLASGKPVIVTAVSEIPLYLDSQNSFIVKPGCKFTLAQSMIKIKENAFTAKKIGLEGKKIAETHFNILTYEYEFIRFLKI